MRHVAGGINVHQQADEGDDAEHDDGELVHLQRKIYFELAGGDPSEVSLDPGDLVGGKLREFANQFRKCEKCQSDRADGHRIYDGLGEILAQQAVDGRAEKRQRDDDPEMVEYEH